MVSALIFHIRSIQVNQFVFHAGFLDMPQLITCMQINYSQWKKYDEQGVNTLADIMAKQPPVGNKTSNSK